MREAFRRRLSRAGAAISLVGITAFAGPACEQISIVQTKFLPGEQASPTVVPTERPQLIPSPVAIATATPEKIPPTVTPRDTATPTPELAPRYEVQGSAYDNYLRLTRLASGYSRTIRDRQNPQPFSAIESSLQNLVHQQVSVLNKFDTTIAKSVDKYTVQIGQDRYDLRKYSDRLYTDALLSLALRQQILPEDEVNDWFLQQDKHAPDAFKKLESNIRYLKERITFAPESNLISLEAYQISDLADAYRVLDRHGRTLPKSVNLSQGFLIYEDLEQKSATGTELNIYEGRVLESIGVHLLKTEPEYFNGFKKSVYQYYEKAGSAIENLEYSRFDLRRQRMVFSDSPEEAFCTTFMYFMTDGQRFVNRIFDMDRTDNPSTDIYSVAYLAHSSFLGFELLIPGVERTGKNWQDGDRAFVYEYDGNAGVNLRDREGEVQSIVHNGTPLEIVDRKDDLYMPHPTNLLESVRLIKVRHNGSEFYMAMDYLSTVRR